MSSQPYADLDPRLLGVIVRACEVRDAAGFEALVAIGGPLQELLQYEMAICGIGGVSPQGSVVQKVVNVHYPVDYFYLMRDAEGRVDTPLMQKWRATLEPVLFQQDRDDALYPGKWLEAFRLHDLRNTLAHGVQDLTGTLSSFFVFSRLAGEVGERHAFWLRVLTPHLHQALAQALPTIDDYEGRLGAPAARRLSPRQRDILHWLHEGKTNWEIAQILGLTALNVKYHVDQIYAKLEVRSRAQAVAKAQEMGLLARRRSEAA
jgi:transcriptional regulator EpsA